MKTLSRIYHFILFVFYYLKTVIEANISLAAIILAPRLKMTTAIIDVPLDTRNENQILAMSNFISMTPGSLTLNYDEKSNSLKVHIMYVGNAESFYKTMENLQNKIIKIF